MTLSTVKESNMPEISSKAIVEPKAKVADDVRIGPFTHIGPNVKIAAGCTIAGAVTITGKTTIAENTRVFPMAIIGAPDAQCTIGPNTTIREHVTIYGGIERPTSIGKNNLIMIGCRIDSGAAISDHGIFANSTQFGKGCNVESYVRTSAFTLIDAGVKLGAYTFTAGYVHVNRNAPPFAMLHGMPFRVRGANTQNLQRCGFGDNDIRKLKTAFHEIYNSTDTAPDTKVIRRMMKKPPDNPYVRKLVEAINNRNSTEEEKRDD